MGLTAPSADSARPPGTIPHAHAHKASYHLSNASISHFSSLLCNKSPPKFAPPNPTQVSRRAPSTPSNDNNYAKTTLSKDKSPSRQHSVDDDGSDDTKTFEERLQDVNNQLEEFRSSYGHQQRAHDQILDGVLSTLQTFHSTLEKLLQQQQAPSPACDIVYDPSYDQLLVYTEQRVRMYRRKSTHSKQFVYLRGKPENSFPSNAMTVEGHWQCDSYIMTEVTKRKIIHMLKIGPQGIKHQRKPQDPALSSMAERPSSPTLIQCKHNPLKRIVTAANRPRPRTHCRSKINARVTSNKLVAKHSKHRRIGVPVPLLHLYRLTRQHLDAYFAIAEVILEQNVEPG